ncbi:MAG TPA: putative porin [Prolixibacteraceae bacterium]|nr:putative porin [Prolixibacteraceae bacterium]
MNLKLIFLFVTLLSLSCLIANGQSRTMEGNQGGSGSQGQQDSDKGKKDSIVFKMREYKLLDDLTRISEVKVDTTISDFHIYNVPYKNSLSVQTLGNIGNSYQSGDFYQRRTPDGDFLFQMNYYDYGSWPGGIKFYNVTKPYTLLSYGQWFSNKPKGETVAKVFHTQNINKSINFGFYFNSIGSSGKYLNQEAKDKNLGIFTSGNFERYDYWLSVGTNKFDNQENGGLPNPEDIENPDIEPENISVWLTDVKSSNKNIFGTLTHQFKLGTWKEMQDTLKKEIYEKFIPRVALTHVLDLHKSTRNFTEVDPNPSFTYTTDEGTVFFYGKDHVPYINKVPGSADAPATIDKSGKSVISNRFVLKFMEAPDRKYTFGKQIFISNDLVNIYFPREELVTDTAGVSQPPLGMTQSDKYSNTYIGGSAYRTDGRFWSWTVTGKSYIQGRNALDYEISGAIDKPLRSKKDTSFVRFFTKMANRTPDYFYDRYYSNHYKWENEFDKTYTLHFGATMEKPGWRMKAAINYSIINKFVFFNEMALPEQARSEFSVASAMLNKDFKFGGLNIRNWVVLQRTTTDLYLVLPALSVRNSTYFEGMYVKTLLFQFGFDTRYESAYYADQYSPATGMFYRQTAEKIGDYPWIDGFINLKLKRTAFYIKYTNLATQFIKGGYYTSPSYPAPASTFLFGLAWSFYN